MSASDPKQTLSKKGKSMSGTIDIRLTSDELRFVISCGSALLLNIPEGSLPTYTHFSKAEIIDFSLRMREQLDQAGYDM
jgi:hypothetical protein